MRVAVGGLDGEGGEAELFRRASEGDRKAWEALWEHCHERLERFILSRLGPEQAGLDSSDVVQEVFIRAFRLLPDRRCESLAAFKKWLRRVAEKAIKDLIHRNGCIGPLEPGGEGPRFDRLAAAIKALSPDHRRVVILHYLRGIPLKEMGKRMGRTTDAVAMLLRRALKKLRDEFGR